MEREKTLLGRQTDYLLLGVSKDGDQVLVADGQPDWIDEALVFRHPLITRYQDELPPLAQLTNWIKRTVPQLTARLEEEPDVLDEDLLEQLNLELAKHNQALLVHSFLCEDGTKEWLALAYDPSKEEKGELENYLKYQVEPFYQDGLMALYSLAIQTLQDQELDEAIKGKTPYLLDRSLLDEDRRILENYLHQSDFLTVQEMRKTEQRQNQEKEQDTERGR